MYDEMTEYPQMVPFMCLKDTDLQAETCVFLIKKNFNEFFSLLTTKCNFSFLTCVAIVTCFSVKSSLYPYKLRS